MYNGSECCMLYSQLKKGAILSIKSCRNCEKYNIYGCPIIVSKNNYSIWSSTQGLSRHAIEIHKYFRNPHFKIFVSCNGEDLPTTLYEVVKKEKYHLSPFFFYTGSNMAIFRSRVCKKSSKFQLQYFPFLSWLARETKHVVLLPWLTGHFLRILLIGHI